MKRLDLSAYHNTVIQVNPVRVYGKVTRVTGLMIEGHGPGSHVGSVCRIHPKDERPPFLAEVVGFRDNRVLLMPLGDIRGVGPGSRIVALGESASVGVGRRMVGRVLDGQGMPVDGGPPIYADTRYPLYADPLNPMKRARISEAMDVGIRPLNALLTLGKGQRMGIFAGSGVGKSTLLGMIARYTAADISIIALVGERGREVREFIEKDLGEEGLKRSVVVAATSDQPPLIRLRGAFVATTLAEYFRDQGMDVLLMMDSLTRLAMAQREIGLSVGEPPTTKGYTPSVFALLPKLLERAGSREGGGSITGIYTVLVEGDDFNEPVSDAARAILDGHIMLKRELAAQNHYPSIDLLDSVSRCMRDVVSEEHLSGSRRLIRSVSIFRRSEDLINIGAYVQGTNPQIDSAIDMHEPIRRFLCQGIREKVTLVESVKDLLNLFPAGD